MIQLINGSTRLRVVQYTYVFEDLLCYRWSVSPFYLLWTFAAYCRLSVYRASIASRHENRSRVG